MREKAFSESMENFSRIVKAKYFINVLYCAALEYVFVSSVNKSNRSQASISFFQ